MRVLNRVDFCDILCGIVRDIILEDPTFFHPPTPLGGAIFRSQSYFIHQGE